MQKKKIVLFTDGFPFDPGETPFIYNELCELSKSFDITIVAYTRKQFENAKICIELPANVDAKKYVIEDVGRKEVLINWAQVISSKAYRSEMADIAGKPQFKAMKKEAVWYLVRTILFKKWIEKNIDVKGTDLFYSYWNNFGTLAIAMLREKNENIKLVTRMHGYDLYDERTNFGRQYFKPYIDKCLNKACFISQHGMDFYKNRYKSGTDDKYSICLIGVKAAGNVPQKSLEELSKNRFTIASCSSVIPLKRVELIVQALSMIEDIQIRWIHIGAGSEFSKIEKLCKERLDNKANIVYELKGYMNNAAVREFYDKEYIDFFITTSSTEGSPVSIQEALSYGIPVIGTEVGEVPRLVEGNGILLKTNPELEEIKQGIIDMCSKNLQEQKELRNRAFSKWQEKYDALKNASEFVALLESL